MGTAEKLIAEARVVDVHCTVDRLIVHLDDDRELSVPLRWYPRLASASPQARANWQKSAAGYGIHWPEIDEDLSVEGLLLGQAAPGVVK